MKQDYENRAASENSDESEGSDNSIKIYHKAYASFRPEQGESNAEAAERHRLIEERVREIKQERKRETEQKCLVRIKRHFHTSSQLRRTIDIRQRRTTIKRQHRDQDSDTMQQSIIANGSSTTTTEPTTQCTITQDYTRYERLHSVSFSKILYILNITPSNHDL